MPVNETLDLNKAFTFWKSGTGTLNVHAPQLANLDAPITADTNLLSLNLALDSNKPLSIGNSQLALSIDAKSQASLSAIFPGSSDKVLTSAGVADLFNSADFKDDVMLALQIQSSVDGSGTVKVPLQFLTAQGSVNAGADVSYNYLRPFPNVTPFGPMLGKFLGDVSLPNGEMPPLDPGEAITFEYGGYLKLGAQLSVGYEMSGTPSVDLGKLKLADRYKFSVLGSLGGHAQIAGRFQIDVLGIPTPPESTQLGGVHPHSRWAQVTVRKKRSDELGFAADVSVSLDNQVDNLPGSPLEFLGAMLGVSSKSWFSYLEQAAQAKSFDDLKNVTDTLSWWYLGKLLGKSFGTIQADVEPVLGQIQSYIQAYNNFDQTAINFFDRFYDKADSYLAGLLQQVTKLDSWDALFGKAIPDDLANAIGALTGADVNHPLSWVIAMAGDQGGLADLQTRAQSLLDKVQNGAHQGITEVIRTAKQFFGLDTLISQLQTWTNIDQLKSQANTLLGGLASRIVGKDLTKIDANDQAQLKQTLNTLVHALNNIRNFTDKVWGAVNDAVNSSYSIALHAEYARASDDDKLLVAQFNLDSPRGRTLFGQACVGDFGDLLAAFGKDELQKNPNAVRLLEAAFTHTVSKKGAFSVNILGWHDRFNFTSSGFSDVIVKAEQRIKASADGHLLVSTQFDLNEDRERKQGFKGREAEVHTNFLLQFMGMSKGQLDVDKKTEQYLIDSVEAIGASYELDLSKNGASRPNLDYFLTFARDFNIPISTPAANQIAASLPMANGNYGTLKADYRINYAAGALGTAFSPSITDEFLQFAMRRIVATAYVGSDNIALQKTGFAYFTPTVYELWKELGGAAFTNVLQPRNLQVRSMPGIVSPKTVVLTKDDLEVLDTLFNIEGSMVAAFNELRSVVTGAAGKLSPDKFAAKLSRFGSALKEFNDFAVNNKDSINPVFALFDHMVAAGVGGAARQSYLELEATAGGVTAHQLYRSVPAGAAVPLGAHA